MVNLFWYERLQHIAYKQSVSGNDVITHIYYDDHGRQSRGYLPYVSSGSTMNFNDNPNSSFERIEYIRP